MSNMDSTKQYIGDGVYADIENGMLKLTTEDGISVQNTIYLGHTEFSILLEYFAKRVEHIR